MLFIPFGDYAQAVGGPGTFMRNLQPYLDGRGVPYTVERERGTAAFFPIKYDLDLLKRYKRRGFPIVQRLDGVYHFGRNGFRYLLLNREIKRIYREFADYVVFQSDYSRRQCFALFGAKPKSQYTTIVNGADSTVFRPGEPRQRPSTPLRLVTSASFRHLDMLEPIVLALDALAGELEFELTVVGPVPEPIRAATARPHVRFAGNMAPDALAMALAQSDVYLFASLNPPCPNAVLEAIACGLPVVGFAEGSMPELLGFSRELLAEVPDKLFLRPEDRDPRALADKLRLCVRDYAEFAERARARCRDYEFSRCGAEYVRVFEQIGALRP